MRRLSQTTFPGIILTTVFAVAAAAVIATGCAARASLPSTATFDEAFEITPGTRFATLDGAKFGGVSGLAFDAASGELLGISDDRDDNRVFRLRLHEHPLSVEPIGVIRLSGSPAKLDAEGIVLLPDGHLLISSEGLQNEQPRQPPGIFEFAHDGTFVRALALRDRFMPNATGPITRGVRGNSSFESLTLSPDGQTLFTATETALAQDGNAADFDHGALSRLMEYRRQGDTFVPGREWIYELEPIERPDFTPGFSVTGLAELLALSDTEFLALERSYVQEAREHGRDLNRIRLFKVSLDGGSEISALDSIAGRTDLRPVRKQLLLDLQKAPGLPPALNGLDNFEGLALLPALPDGRRPLMVVSDDNFSDTQKTWFVRLMLH